MSGSQSNDWWKQVYDVKNYGEPSVSSGESLIFKKTSPFNLTKNTNHNFAWGSNNSNNEPCEFSKRYFR